MHYTLQNSSTAVASEHVEHHAKLRVQDVVVVVSQRLAPMPMYSFKVFTPLPALYDAEAALSAKCTRHCRFLTRRISLPSCTTVDSLPSVKGNGSGCSFPLPCARMSAAFRAVRRSPATRLFTRARLSLAGAYANNGLPKAAETHRRARMCRPKQYIHTILPCIRSRHASCNVRQCDRRCTPCLVWRVLLPV